MNGVCDGRESPICYMTCEYCCIPMPTVTSTITLPIFSCCLHVQHRVLFPYGLVVVVLIVEQKSDTDTKDEQDQTEKGHLEKEVN